MKKQDFYFALPQELIAQEPLKDRASSRLLVLNKQGEIEHKKDCFMENRNNAFRIL